MQPDCNWRGVFRTSEDGTYWFKAVRPQHYSIADDGPVGELLYALGRHPYRPAHLHYIVSKEGYDEVTTHIFDPDDIYINNDAVFGVKESLIADFVKIEDRAKISEMGFDGSFYWQVDYDFVLAATP